MMRVNRWTGWRMAAAALVAVATLGAGAELRGMDAAARVPGEPAIHPTLLVSEPAAGQARVELVLRRVEMPEQIASYQGEISYDRAAMRLVRAEVPAGLTGMFNEVEPGRIRFAGVKVEGVGDGPVLVLHVTPSRPLAAEQFRVSVTEVSSAALDDLTPRVVTSGATLVRVPR